MKTEMWYLIIIKDSQDLSGTSIFKILNIIQKTIRFEYVILNDINGAGVAELAKKENTPVLVADLIMDIEKVVQFDWGDFFLFKNFPKQWDNKKSYPNLVTESDTTIRAIDDTYIYIYTQYKEILNILSQFYNIESISFDFIENLEFPY